MAQVGKHRQRQRRRLLLRGGVCCWCAWLLLMVVVVVLLFGEPTLAARAAGSVHLRESAAADTNPLKPTPQTTKKHSQHSNLVQALADRVRQDDHLVAGLGAPDEVDGHVGADAVAAHEAMEQRGNYGKIVMVTPFGAAFLGDYAIAGG